MYQKYGSSSQFYLFYRKLGLVTKIMVIISSFSPYLIQEKIFQSFKNVFRTFNKLGKISQSFINFGELSTFSGFKEILKTSQKSQKALRLSKKKIFKIFYKLQIPKENQKQKLRVVFSNKLLLYLAINSNSIHKNDIQQAI